MKRRQLAGSDAAVSRIGLGTSSWGTRTTDVEDAARQLAYFVDAGGNLVDTADIYARGRSEEVIGRLLNRVVPRSKLFLATKAGAVIGTRPRVRIDSSRRYLLDTLDASLKRLATDYVDLWQVHGWDSGTALEETHEALDTAVSSGRARYAGVCNYAGWQLAKACARRPEQGANLLVSCQVEYSLLERGIERELVPAALDSGTAVLAWAPLGRGVLTGKYVDGIPAEKIGSNFFEWYVRHNLAKKRTPSIVETVMHLADRLGVSPMCVSLAWVRDRPAVAAAIIGARTADQLRESLAAESLELPDEARERLDEISAPYIGYPERALP